MIFKTFGKEQLFPLILFIAGFMSRLAVGFSPTIFASGSRTAFFLYITIITDKKKETYQVFSVHVETSDWGYMKIDFKSKDDWLNHLTQFKNRSMYDTGVQVTKDDSILILQTCSKNDHYKNFNKKYLLIISRRVDEYEKTFN